MESRQPLQLLSHVAVDREKVFQWVVDLCNTETRENALAELSLRRDSIHDLGPILWHSTGTIAALLFEIVSSYQYINQPTISRPRMTNICNVLALLQSVAVHHRTRTHFIQAQLLMYIFPFIQNVNKCSNFEHLMLTALGVIGALVKTDEHEVITYLLTTEIIPLCLCVMERGLELCKISSTFILQKILMGQSGLNYICQTYERFSHTALILGKMVLALETSPSTRLLKMVVGCYVCLSRNGRASQALQQCLPEQLKDNVAFSRCILEDSTISSLLLLLKNNLQPINKPIVVPFGKLFN